MPLAASTHQHFSASLGDLIAVAALALAWMTFRLDRSATNRGEASAAVALLRGLRETFFQGVGHLYFSTIYTPAVAEQRARLSEGKMDQVFVVPGEPVAALIANQAAVASRLISSETVIYGTVALWQINKINELVRKQAMFNAVHAPDFLYDSRWGRMRQARKTAVVRASLAISVELHRDGIGDAWNSWYKPLEGAVDRDLRALEARGSPRSVVRRNAMFIPFDAVALVALITVVAAYANSH